MRASILYYTNNLLSPSLLRTTLLETIEHARKNDCELIITSHFPLVHPHEVHPLTDTPHYASYKDIYDHLVKLNISLPDDIPVKAFVVGKLKYELESIIKQLLFMFDQCSTDNIIFMEHDCFYPEEYVDVIVQGLELRELVYLTYMAKVLGAEGYWRFFGESGSSGFMLSRCAAKKDLLKEMYSIKLKHSLEGKKMKFEPVLAIEPELSKKMYEGEVVVDSSLCVDTFLPEDHVQLDIKHGLNQNGNQVGMFIDVAETLGLPKKDDRNITLVDPYWGPAERFWSMVNEVKISDENKKKWAYGISAY